MSRPPSTIVVELRDPVLWITLNRPEKLNSITPQMIVEVETAIDAIDERVRCLVITANGRAFSAGGDLAAVTELASPNGEKERVTAFHASISALLRRIELLPLPVICAVNGLAVAGGLEIAAACDIVVASDQGIFGDAHAQYGLLPGGGGSVRIPRKIGVNRAKYLMLTGRTVSAQTMADWGLVALVVPHATLYDIVNELVGELTARSRTGLARMKSMIDAGDEQPLDVALRNEQATTALHTFSPDYAEGLAAFKERRPPDFN
jgi:enoyl-CoA hydratase